MMGKKESNQRTPYGAVKPLPPPKRIIIEDVWLFKKLVNWRE